MSAPEISVVIPNYNHGRYLKQRIDSVLNQSFSDFEIIILDDCSTDNSRDVILAYNDARIHSPILNDKNSGSPFRQWKKGLMQARGKWIWIAESDDYADFHFLERLVPATRNQNVGLVYCDSRIVSGESMLGETFATIKNKQFRTDRWSSNYINSGCAEIEDFLLPAGTINNTSAVLFNKKVLTESDPFDTEFRYVGDKYAFVKVLARSDVAYIAESLNYFRDPFNKKHSNKYIFYFYEQFLIFDWVLKNMRIQNEDKFLAGFYSNTRSSLFREWNRSKVSVYQKLFMQNRSLLWKSIAYNFRMGLHSLAGE